jgi:aryl-alcohol dehydrogenase-like predicted oxidoreductase
MQRRTLISAAMAVAGGAATEGQAQSQTAPPPPAFIEQDGMKYRSLGDAGPLVSVLGVGGFHLGRPSESDAIRIVRTALDHGLNFLDNCWDYNGGESERRMGLALRDGYRERAFLMTKIDGRTAEAAMRQLEESLRRLRTDRLDLLQFHEIIRMEDPERVFTAGGALEAVLRAREQGKLRFIGFTGHKSPAIHRHMLQTAARHGFHFDTVQMPLNVMDAHFDSFERGVLPLAQEQSVSVLGMKPMGDPFILESRTVGAEDCLRYAMSLPVAVTITGIDSMPVLEQALHVARAFRPLDEEQRTALLARTAAAARDGSFEKYKTGHHFDGTIRNPEWLG